MTVITTPPKFVFQFSPTTNPLSTPTYVDISAYMLDFSCKYGRQFELNRMETGTSSFTLDNTDRRFDPSNSSGAYYPNLIPMRKFQVIAKNTLPVTAAGSYTIGTQAAGTGSAGYVVTDTPATYHDGLFTAASVAADATVLSATTGWFAARLKMGFSSSSVPTADPTLFYWTGTAPSRIACYYANSTKKWTTEIDNSPSGSGLASQSATFNTGDFVTVIVAWDTAAQLAKVSFNGAAFSTGAWTGAVAGMNSTFNIGTGLNALDATVLWAAYGTGTLSNADAATIAGYPSTPVTWSAANYLNPAVDASMMMWPANANMVGVWPAASSAYRVPSNAYVFTGYIEQWPAKWEGPSWAEVDATAVDGFEALSQADLRSTAATLTTTQGSNKDITYTANAGGAGYNSITIAYVNTGSLSISVSGLAITVNINAGTTTANSIITAVNADPIAGILLTASLAPGSSGVGAPAIMSATNLAGGTFAQELTGARVGHVLDAVSWPSTDRAIDTGAATVVSQAFQARDHTKAKTHLNDVENSELGYLFMNAQGFAVYHDRNHRTTATLSTTSNATFGDTSVELEYSGLIPNYDKQYIYNEVDITPFSSSVAQVASDATSQGQYMLRTYALSTLLPDASSALALAQQILNVYKQPAVRFASMDIEPMNDVGLWFQVLSRTIGDRVTVVRRPPTHGAAVGPPISIDCFVESIQWKMSPGLIDVTVTYELSPSSYATAGLKLDDATLGKLDSGNQLSL